MCSPLFRVNILNFSTSWIIINSTPAPLMSMVHILRYIRICICASQIVAPCVMYEIHCQQLNRQSPAEKKDKEYVRPEEWKEIISRFPEGHSCHLPLMLAYHCGLRLGEIFALTWNDIDFENNKIDMQIQMETTGYWTFTAPKYDSYRNITMGKALSDLLKREKKKQDKAKLYYEEYYYHQYVNENHQLIKDIQGVTVPEGCTEVFPLNIRENGTYCQPRITQHLCRIIHYQLGYTLFDMHSLRHTHCCMLLDEGAPIKFVQQRLGHKNVETTLNIYSHLTDKMEEIGTEILDKL